MPTLIWSLTASRTLILIFALALIPSISSGVLISFLDGTTAPFISKERIFSSNASWQCLYFLPLPHQHGALRSILGFVNFILFSFLMLSVLKYRFSRCKSQGIMIVWKMNYVYNMVVVFCRMAFMRFSYRFIEDYL